MTKAAATKSNKQKESRAAANSIFQQKRDPKGALGVANNQPGLAATRLTKHPNGLARNSKSLRLAPPSTLISDVAMPRTLCQSPGCRTIQRIHIGADHGGYTWETTDNFAKHHITESATIDAKTGKDHWLMRYCGGIVEYKHIPAANKQSRNTIISLKSLKNAIQNQGNLISKNQQQTKYEIKNLLARYAIPIIAGNIINDFDLRKPISVIVDGNYKGNNVFELYHLDSSG